VSQHAWRKDWGDDRLRTVCDVCGLYRDEARWDSCEGPLGGADCEEQSAPHVEQVDATDCVEDTQAIARRELAKIWALLGGRDDDQT
jgi:hypothetical protein